MNNLKQLLYYMIGRVPAELHEETFHGKKLLHVSDTPISFYGELARLISILKPDYIVHTGDLADNIKLELFPGSVWRYERDVQKLIKLLESSGAEKIYLALGNHDDAKVLEKLCHRCEILKEAMVVEIENIQFTLSHYASEVSKNPTEVNLFGHNLSIGSGFHENKLYLNGITGINLIELESLRYYSYPYPAGTDNDRLGRGKIGL